MSKIFKRILLMVLVFGCQGIYGDNCSDPVTSQLMDYAEQYDGPVGNLTTTSGMPVSINSMSTLGRSLIRNPYYLDLMTHLYRERIPERTVHGRGAGAYGYFEVTQNVTGICKSKVFDTIGKTTKVFTRFSPALQHRGGADSVREPMGTSVKFYTEEGNLDFLLFNLPIFFVNDPVHFSMIIHAFNPSPVNFIRDSNSKWDFLTNVPEAVNFVFRLETDVGIPDGYRRIPGYSIHTMQMSNSNNETSFVRIHLLPETEWKYLNSSEAAILAGSDPAYFTRDLYNAIGNGNYPNWTLYFQALSLDDVKNAEFNVFDLTKELPIDTYPLQEVGKLVLNENVQNYFAEVDQSAFSPCNLVPGIQGAPDRLFEGRCLSYRDSNLYRLGVNFDNIAVNQPVTTVLSYVRDGLPPVRGNGGSAPNFYPNTFNGPAPVDYYDPEILTISENFTVSFNQSRDLYDSLSTDEQNRTVANIAADLSTVYPEIRDKALEIFGEINEDIPTLVYEILNSTATC